MKRDLAALAATEFDVVVIGGGVIGLCIARDAALRGLRTALVEKDDFGSGASGHWHRIIHGGMRYIQRLDLPRLRVAVRERAAWMRTAPHLVSPCGFLVLTHGMGMHGRPLVALGTAMYDLVTPERGRAPDPAKRIPNRRVLTRDEVLAAEPVANPAGLTGGILFHDGRVHHSGQLLCGLAMSAADSGAALANHCAATGFVRRNGRIKGVQCRDAETGDTFDVRGRIIVNAAGPWVESLDESASDRSVVRSPWILNTVLVCRSVTRSYGLGVPGFVRDAAGSTRPGKRLFFLMPWRDLTLVGTEEHRFEGDPDRPEFGPDRVGDFLSEVNTALPAAEYGAGDVRFVLRGVLPGVSARRRATGLRLSDRARIVAHGPGTGKEGLVSVVSIKFTEARLLAEEVVDTVAAAAGMRARACSTATTPTTGGDIADWAEFRAGLGDRAGGAPTPVVDELATVYGTRATGLLDRAAADASAAEPLAPDAPMVMAQVDVAVSDEMARTLGDVVVRRTELGLLGDPGEPALRRIATRMASPLGWSTDRIDAEVAGAQAWFPIASDGGRHAGA